MIRLSPPSTGIRYTMSALASPVAGRSGTVLPIFTMSTRLSRCTRSPVNGDRSGGRCDGDGEGEGGLGADARWPAVSPRVAMITPVTVSATAAATPTAVSVMLRRSQTIWHTPSELFPRGPAFMIAGAVTAQQMLDTVGPGLVPSLDRTSSAPRSCSSSGIAGLAATPPLPLPCSLSSCKYPQGGQRATLLHDQRAACHDRAPRFVVTGVRPRSRGPGAS